MPKGRTDTPQLNKTPQLLTEYIQYKPPKAVRPELARCLSSLWQRMATSPADEKLWVMESIFFRCILPAGQGSRSGEDQWSQTKLIKDRLKRWQEGKCGELWAEAVAGQQSRPKRGRKKKKGNEEQEGENSQEERNARRCTILTHEGQYTRALQALTSSGIAEYTEETLREMKSKHPAPTTPQPPPPTTNIPSRAFSGSEVLVAALSFKKGSAAGPSGLRPEHLKAILKSTSATVAEKTLVSLVKLVNTMAAGKVPGTVAPYLCGARLHAAKKRDHTLRPIAVGNLLRRLVAKCFSTALASRAASLLGPHQLGVGARGGCEAIAHAVRQATSEDPSKWVLQADLINAYNQVDRGKVLEETANHFPECLAWVTTCYGAPSKLRFGEADILSALGLHQGDPLAGLLFCLALKPVVDAIEEQVPTLTLNAWYCDDANLVGNLEELQAVVDIIQQEGAPRGFILSTSATVPPSKLPKTTIWSPMDRPDFIDQDPLQRGVPRVRAADGITVLGAPVGWRGFVRQTLEAKIEKVRLITELLPLLKDPHSEFVLLRSCLSLPKVMFLLRALDTTDHQDLLKSFDSITRGALSRILGSPVTDDQWTQAKLPVAMGGLGLRAAEDHGSVAYATSLLSSHTMVQALFKRGDDDTQPSLPQSVLEDISAKQGEDIETASLVGVTQKAASLKVDLLNQSLLINHITEEGEAREAARMASLGLPHAGSWLRVVPSPALGLHLRAAEFVPSLKYRLGIPVFSSQGPCPACGLPSDVMGDHALGCAKYGDRIARHDRLRDVIYETASSAALAPHKEERHLLPGTAARPGDILIQRWSDGKDAAMDVTVTSPLAPSNLAAAAQAGGALSKAYTRKVRDTAAACQQQGLIFLPIAVETLGGMHQVAIQQLKKLASALARHTGADEREVTSHLFMRVSLQLMKGNAALLSGRRPDDDHAAAELDGVE